MAKHKKTVEPLTPEFLRASSGMHNFSDEQANEIIDSLYAMARILLTTKLPEQKGCIIPLSDKSKTIAA